MAQQLLLEGKDPQDLLERAHQDYGPNVTIVKAEKVRSGGMMGFFMRESYVLTVEVPDTPVPKSAPRESAVSATDEAALAAELADVAAAQRELLGQAAPAHTSAAKPTSASAPSTSDHTDVDKAAAARRAMASKPIPDEPASPARTFDSEMDALLTPETPAPHQREFSAVQFPALMGEESENVREKAVARQNHAAVQQIWPRSSDRTPAIVEHSYNELSYQDLPAYGAQSYAMPREGQHSIAQLLRMGVPEQMLPTFVRPQQTVSSYEVAARLAGRRARRPQPGEVLVLAGDPEQALRAATQVAFWAHMPVTDVVLAGPGPSVTGHGRRVLGTVAAARVRDRAGQARAQGKPVIVALGIEPGPAGKEAAAVLQAAIAPNLTWAVVDAGMSDTDRRIALEGVVGGAGDVAIAATGLAHAQAPAAVVDAPWPVAWLDGLPASPAVWAAVLDDRAAGDMSPEGPWSG